MPRAVCCGEGALKKMPEILQAASVKKAAVFTDKGIRSAGLLDPVLEQLQKSQAAFCVLDDLPPEPSYGQVQKLVDACRAEGADMILAVGGGSVMDTAKLAGVLLDGSSTVHDLLEAPGRAKKCCPTLMIPTTAGTGSEATPNAIVAVPEQELKVGIVSDAMIADNVLLDPLMIKNLPRKIAAATGVDALAHAIECYTSNKANPISDTFALEALDMILNNILPACDSADAVSQKSAMQLASFYAGVAITASGTTAVHALSYPLGGKYHIAHGVSNAILLAPVMRFNAPACPERFAAAYDRCVWRKNLRDAGGKNGVYAALAGEDRPASGDTHKPFGIRCACVGSGDTGGGRHAGDTASEQQSAPGDGGRRPRAVPPDPLTSERTEKHE